MSKALHMNFMGDAGSDTKTFQMPDPKAELTPAEVKELATAIISGKVLLVGSQPATKFTKAYVREISDSELFNADAE